MDIYQILIIHNRPWSAREVICFSIVFLAAVTAAVFLVQQKKIIKSQAVAALLLLIFLGIVFASTVFTRMPMEEHKYELELFWSWKEVVYNGSRFMLEENLLNMILLFPMGILLPIVFHKRLPWWAGLLMGILVSAGIELSQLVFRRGLFEWDDMVHNGIGCMAGCMISGMLMECKKRRKLREAGD